MQPFNLFCFNRHPPNPAFVFLVCDSTCLGTEWQCTKHECFRTCFAYGDPHYRTFDGKWFKFQGSCEYILAQDYCGSSQGSFRIQVKNIPCGTSGVTCTKATTITLNDTVIALTRGEEPKISALPGNELSSLAAEHSIEKSGLLLILKTKIGLTIVWDYGTRVYVTLDPSFKGRERGREGRRKGRRKGGRKGGREGT